MVHSDTDQEVPMRVPRVLSLILAGAIAAIGPGANGAALQEPATKGQPLAADTPSTTVAGHTFIAPAGWTVSVKGKATIVEAPEGRLADRLRGRRGDGARRRDTGGLGRVSPRREVAAQGADGLFGQRRVDEPEDLFLPDVAERAAGGNGGDKAARGPAPGVDLRHGGSRGGEAGGAGGSHLQEAVPEGLLAGDVRRAEGEQPG